MTLDTIREAHQAQPFKPFTLRLADGRSASVPHPEFLLIPPRNPRTLVLATPTGGIRLIDLLLVTEIEFGGSTRNGSRPRRRRAG